MQVKYFQLVTFIILLNILNFSQSLGIDSYLYISPVPGSSFHLPQTSIIIRQGEVIDDSKLKSNMITVSGTKSGIHRGEFFLASDLKTLIFEPFIEFSLGEQVSVKLNEPIKTISGNMLRQFEFSFRISGSVYGKTRQCYEDLSINNKVLNKNYKLSKSNHSLLKYRKDLPEDFPTFEVSILDNPSFGYIFLAPYSAGSSMVGYIMILDNDATPIYYQRSNSAKLDFKIQHNRLLTYWDHIPQKYFMMDSSYAVIDSFECGGGYLTDSHDLLIFENGHSFLLANDPQQVRMDTVVQGGDSTAIVWGLIIQELDAERNVIFQWRSWDHFKITDATYDIDLTAHSVDYVHGNAIELDSDGNLLLSSRHLDEITKINRQTGEIIWRLGGLYSKNNQFQFIGDPVTFSHQHDIRRLANGNITLFDNGNLHNPAVSRSLEYQLDETNKTAELVWKFNNDPVTFAPAMANCRRLANQNTIIGWGWHLNPRAVSEINADGSIALEWLLPDTVSSYRAFKYTWRTNYFRVNPDSIFFESIAVGDSAIIQVAIENNSLQQLNINGLYNKNSIYTVEDSLPIIVPPLNSVEISVKFKPLEDGYFKDYLHIRSDTDTSRIAQVLILAGRTDTTFSSVENEILPGGYKLEQNYPNPFNPRTKITYSVPEDGFVNISVYNVLGQKVANLVNTNLKAGNYNISFDATNISSGMYIYRMEAGEFVSVKKMMILK